MKCEVIDDVMLPADEYIYLRDKFRIHNGNRRLNKTITIELYDTYTPTRNVTETVTLQPSAWYDFSELLRDFFVFDIISYYHVCFSIDTPGIVKDNYLYIRGYTFFPPYNVCGIRYSIDGALKKTVEIHHCMDCPPPKMVWQNIDIYRALPVKDNYGEVVLFGEIEVPTQEVPCCDCEALGYVLHPYETYFTDKFGNRVEVNINGVLVQNDNCRTTPKKRMARLLYQRGDGTGIVRWCEVVNETIKTAQTKSKQRLLDYYTNWWATDTCNNIKRTVTLEWRDFPPDEIDRIAMGVALTSTCLVYMDNGTVYSGTLETSATLKVAGNLQITLNVEVA